MSLHRCRAGMSQHTANTAHGTEKVRFQRATAAALFARPTQHRPAALSQHPDTHQTNNRLHAALADHTQQRSTGKNADNNAGHDGLE